MSVTVEIGTVRGFILDDPVAGVLDNTEYTLGGLDFVDVSAFVRELDSGRGKNRDLERFSAGTMDVRLNNQTRYFDPFAATAIDPVPRVPIRAKYDDELIFTGVVDDWDYEYSPGGVSTATVKCSDGFSELARRTVATTGTAVAQKTGERIEAVLDQVQVSWPDDDRLIDTGDSDLNAQVFDGENVLEYLQLVEASEQGALFMNKSGQIEFESRTSATPTSSGLITFADDGTGVDYHQVLVNYGTELMVNRATVSTPSVDVVAENELSKVTYGVISSDISVLEMPTVQAQNLANFTVEKYAEPEYRFEALLINLDELPSGDIDSVIGIELADVVRVKFTPNDIGDAIDQYAQVIGIEHEVEPTSHIVTLRLASLDWTFLVLDDAVFGKMDVRHLGF